MDSLTQGLLGAVTFALIKDKKIGKKSVIIGAIAGTIPDMDVFLAPLFNDVELLSVHRSVSHSIIFAVLSSILLGTIFHKIYEKKHSHLQWMLAFFLAIFTHSLLDWCTTYGTKLLSPFTSHLFSTNNIHVFEPIYTSILLVGVILLVIKKHPNKARHKIIQITLFVSSLYLLWTFASKGIANSEFVNELENRILNMKN
ncbi:MAG: metal-dependent hydrolase [Saprospiraceae bacterium]